MRRWSRTLAWSIVLLAACEGTIMGAPPVDAGPSPVDSDAGAGPSPGDDSDGATDDTARPTSDAGAGDGLERPDPIPDPGTRELAEIIRSHPEGGVVWLPDGVYEKGTVRDFAPASPLVLVAESRGGVVVTRSDAIVGQTSVVLENVRDVAFVGLRFERVTVALNGARDLAFWYTEHTIPAETHTEPRRKLCGGGRSPDAFLVTGSERLYLFGVTIDDVGHDGIKVGNTDDLTLVGAEILNVHHAAYQTETTPEDAASCGHRADDLFHHSDGIQIYPGGVNRLTVSDSYVQTQLMWQVESGGSCRDLRIQRSLLDARFGDCQTLNTRVKTSADPSAEMNITVIDTRSHCDEARVDNRFISGSPKWHFITLGTRCPNHTLLVRDVEFLDAAAPTHTPADAWRELHPFSRWPCFLDVDVGFPGFARSCTDGTGFPSYEPADPTGAVPFEHHACNGAYG